MSPGAYVQDASDWAGSLVRLERERGHPDPISVVARQGRVSKNAIWSLVYRPPKKVAADVYFAIAQLYERECARQAEKYEAERARTEAKTRLGAALMETVDRLDCEDLPIVSVGGDR